MGEMFLLKLTDVKANNAQGFLKHNKFQGLNNKVCYLMVELQDGRLITQGQTLDMAGGANLSHSPDPLAFGF